MAIREALLAEFDHEMAATRRLLLCVPQDRLSWAPHPRSRSFGELVAHIIEVTNWSSHILEQSRFDLEDAVPAAAATSTAGTPVEMFGASVARARTLLDRGDAELSAPWLLRQEGRELFVLPRAAAFRTFVLGHVVHHRGQLSVYLRLNDIAVPSIYGPTADSRRSQNSEGRTEKYT